MATLKIFGIVRTSRKQFSTSAACCGKRNFRKFPLFGFRGTNQFKKQQAENPDPLIPVHTYGVKPTGYKLDGKFYEIPEKIPELVVPDLTGCELMPYVSYRATERVTEPFTSQELFAAVYADKIESDWKAGALDEKGDSLNPSENEKLTPEEAWRRARSTGSDIF